MIDVKQTDEFYEWSVEHLGKPPLTANFDRRVLLPLSAVASHLSSEDEVVTEAQVREFAAKRWVTILNGAETEDDPNAPGLPLYAITRLGAYRELAAGGLTDAELAAHAEFEEGLIDGILAVDELAYEDDDRAQLLLDLEDDRVLHLARRDDVEEGREVWEAKMARIERDLAYVRQLDPARMSDAERHRIGRFAYRVRHRNEMIRALLVAPHYEQMRAGYSFFVACSQHGFDESGWYFRGIRWAETLHDPAVTEETSLLPIRVPGFVLDGGRITPTRTLTPDEYARLWKEADLDEYRAMLALIWGEKECPHCRRPVRRGGSARRVYCSTRCSQAARQARHRQRNPDAVKLAQLRWRQWRPA